MADKDLGESLDNVEEGIENLKNKEFRVFGIKVSFMSVSALVALLGSVVGALYGGFLMYQKVEQAIEFVEQQEEYEQKIADYDQRMEIMEAQLNETLDYARDIKNDLRDDLVRMEKVIDQVEDDVKDVEGDVREIVQNAEERFENKRDALQNDYDQAKDRLQTNTERELKDLEDRLNKRLQRALDNPLAN
jgi:uncharacterized protein YoxC